ncbi:hypothetical protein [Aquihabitans sp. McL0605]|uniref:hypothetical protein n=1 Tax=Aquihabitans sp. McL0605 TaxID=3415671 RepID=UPI003CF6266D
MRASNHTTDPSPDGDGGAAEAAAGAGAAGSGPVADPFDPDREGVYDAQPGGMLDLGRSHPVIEVVYRHRAQVGGRVRSVRIRPWGEIPTLEAVVADATGALTVAFLGRRSIAGIRPGGWLTVEGMVGQRNEKLVILNPAYDLRPID